MLYEINTLFYRNRAQTVSVRLDVARIEHHFWGPSRCRDTRSNEIVLRRYKRIAVDRVDHDAEFVEIILLTVRCRASPNTMAVRDEACSVIAQSPISE
jgi:hypothetical protein